jgi:hypothetical protein
MNFLHLLKINIKTINKAYLTLKLTLISIFFYTIIYYFISDNHLIYTNITKGHKLIDCFYYSFVTQSTVGYGDIVPVTNLSKLITISQIFLTYIILLLY